MLAIHVFCVTKLNCRNHIVHAYLGMVARVLRYGSADNYVVDVLYVY